MNWTNKRITIPIVYNAINEAEDDNLIVKYENMLLCMFISPILLVGSVANILVRYLIFHRELLVTLMDSAVLLLFGLCFELLLRIDFKIKARLISHFTSALFAVFYMYVVVKYYSLIGPSLWIFAFIPIVLSMVHSTKILWFYTGLSLFISWIYVTFIASRIEGLTNHFYILSYVFFALLFFASMTVNKINFKRIHRIMNQLKELKKQIEVNERLALYEQLTGLPNRTHFYELLRQAVVHAKSNGTNLYVLFLDLDLFKMINDTMGHTQGDEMLKQVGKRLSDSIRKNDIVARIGGDEFLIMLRDVSSEREIVNIATFVLEQINRPFMINQRPFHITCSIGISKFPFDGEDAETIIKHADLALNKAKEEGKNRFFFYTDNLVKIVQHEMSMINEMRQALRKKEFELYYQPQFNGATKEIIGFEALLRWNHPTRGLLSPGAFISVAEKTELIVSIGEWVIRTACMQNKVWQNERIARVPVAVNLSVKQICNNSLTQKVLEILQETNLSPKYLELEITEKILIKDIKNIKNELVNLKQLGVKIAIDDFGTGYSSLQYLKEFPVDCIKIPIDFIRGIDNNSKDESIITVILAMAEIMNLDVIAEGVETKNQLDFLLNKSCKNIQGYYFCKPMKASEVELFCKEAGV